MIKPVKRVLIILAIITILALIGIAFYSSGRTYFNEDDEVGNSTGNIYNGGLFCEQDGKIYFSNDAADGKLYVMNSDCTDLKKVYDDKAVFINADKNYVYYVRANNTMEDQRGSILMFYNTGVFRLNHNGKGLKAFTSNPGAYLMLRGNNIYFQRYDVGIGLYLFKYQIDGSMERLLLEDAVIPATVVGNSVYYTGYSKDHNINAMDLSSFTHHPIYQGNYYYPIFQGNYIYYVDLDHKYNIYRMNLDGSVPTLLVEEQCFTYNITNDGKYLFYQVDDGKNNRICRMNLETLDTVTLMEGNYKQIHVTDHYVFFKDFDNKNTFILEADGIPDISTFDPMDLDATD